MKNDPIDEVNLPDKFASFFKDKDQHILSAQSSQDNVYNGNKKLNSENFNFMLESDVLLAMNSLKIKNCKSHYHIPLKILADGA